MRLIKELAREIITSFNFHHKGNQSDILILSSPRSGSTWLMEMLYTQPGVKYINEPLGKRRLDYHKLLPIQTRWRYNSLTSFEESVLIRYFQGDGRARLFGPVNFFERSYSLVTNRVVFKIVRANALIEWFYRELDVQIVFLIRHPIAQSLSCIRRGHQDRVLEYLRDEEFMNRYVDRELENYVRGVLETGSPLEISVTQWCLSNLVPLGRWPKHAEWLAITYEELVLRASRFVDLLCEELDLPARERLLAATKRPSRVTSSSGSRTRNKIEAGDADYLVTKWKRHVSDQEERSLFSILRRFNIDAYEPGRYFASEELLHFGPLSIASYDLALE